MLRLGVTVASKLMLNFVCFLAAAISITDAVFLKTCVVKVEIGNTVSYAHLCLSHDKESTHL